MAVSMNLQSHYVKADFSHFAHIVRRVVHASLTTMNRLKLGHNQIWPSLFPTIPNSSPNINQVCRAAAP